MSTERPRLHAFVCLICLLSPAALLYRPADVDGAITLPAGAAIVERTAEMVQDRYVDPVAGSRIADALRRDLRRGAFAGISSRSELGRRLQDRFRALTAAGEIQVIQGGTDVAPTVTAGPWVRALATADGVGILTLRALPDLETAAGKLRAALRGLEDSRSLVVDLRGVAGGDPATARHLAERLDGGTVFLLVDAGTSGAAEQLAQRLRRAGRATLIGEPTAGVAWSYAELELSEGLRLRTPVSRLDPETESDWQGIGLFPDLPVPASRALDVAEREARRCGGEELPPRPVGLGGSGAMSLS